MMARTFELRHQAFISRKLRFAVPAKFPSSSEVGGRLEESMMWIDIGVTLLLTLRIALFRPTLPLLMDPKNAAWLQPKKDGEEKSLLIGDADVSEPALFPEITR